MKKITWVVIANAIKAEIYELTKEGCILVIRLTHPDGRLKSIDLTSDQPGHYQTGNGAHGQFTPPSNPHETEHKQFAKEIVSFLEKNKQQNHYQSLVICAEPHFHGLLNKVITEPLRSVVSKFIEKDYVPLLQTNMKGVIEAIVDATI